MLGGVLQNRAEIFQDLNMISVKLEIVLLFFLIKKVIKKIKPDF
jgi:hypothetical protein